MKKKHRVLFFKPALNWILGHCYTILLLVLIGVALILFLFFKNRIVNFLNGHNIVLSTLQENVLSGLIVFVVSLLIGGVGHFIRKNSKNARWIKRKTYNVCTYIYKNIHIPTVLKNFISNMVNLFYCHNRETIQAQQNVVNNILDSLSNT
ncbi:MAG TPA: hypothetical protein DDY31_15755, partial [Lachnospiraceae bacterium]|nr:hypothetical protein [Lachnospiraceae bacterium]